MRMRKPTADNQTQRRLKRTEPENRYPAQNKAKRENKAPPIPKLCLVKASQWASKSTSQVVGEKEGKTF